MDDFINKIDAVYVINLKNKHERKKKIKELLELIPFNKIKYIDAFNAKIPIHVEEYDKLKPIIRKKYLKLGASEDDINKFFKWSFQLGAYGCLKSHIQVVQDAVENDYNIILVLEDDITFSENLIQDLNNCMHHIPDNWDFAYLGKKQGSGVPIEEIQESKISNESKTSIESKISNESKISIESKISRKTTNKISKESNKSRELNEELLEKESRKNNESKNQENNISDNKGSTYQTKKFVEKSKNDSDIIKHNNDIIRNNNKMINRSIKSHKKHKKSIQIYNINIGKYNLTIIHDPNNLQIDDDIIQLPYGYSSSSSSDSSIRIYNKYNYIKKINKNITSKEHNKNVSNITSKKYNKNISNLTSKEYNKTNSSKSKKYDNKIIIDDNEDKLVIYHCHKKKVIKNSSEYWYLPNKETWASHAWLINKTIFKDLLKYYNKFMDPVDIVVHKLFDKYNFYVLKNDLFITGYESDIRELNQYEIRNYYKKWNWQPENYYPIDITNVSELANVIVVGFHPTTNKDHTHTYIHTNVYNTFKKLYPHLNVMHVPELTCNVSNTIIFASPAQNENLELPKHASNFYIIHIDYNNDLNKIYEQFKEEIKDNRILFLTCRNYDNNKYYNFSLDNNTICLPWASDLDPKRILDNYYKIQNMKKLPEKTLVFFGSVWYLNIDSIINLARIAKNNNYKLIIIGRINHTYYKMVKEENENVIIKNFFSYKNDTDSIDTIIEPNTYILTIQGQEHYNNYITCRLFSTISRGYLGLNNNPFANTFIKNIIMDENIETLIHKAFSLTLDEYKNILTKQIIDVYFNHTYDNRIFEYVKATQNILMKRNLSNYRENIMVLENYTSKLTKSYIVFLGFQRSGSSYLGDLMDSFKNVHGAQEVYQSGKLGFNYSTILKLMNDYNIIDNDNEKILRNNKIVNKRDTSHYVDTLLYIEKITDEPIISLKIFPDNNINLANILELISNTRIIPILLKRNFNDIYVSYKKAKKTSQYANFDYTDIKIDFDKYEYDGLYFMYSEWFNTLEQYMISNNISYYLVNYEDLNNINFNTYFAKIGIDIGNQEKEIPTNIQNKNQGNYDCFTNKEEFENYIKNK
ncbi:glycosyltransferase family 25 [Hokovirus HKV1]|uniref:Glycosyltransferase family 25 n=1 Tax=Hokovirus HKV1 TaxID=1977638 RepID=A0A1V0SGR8_9VIRU|nr:glycosyltransferase family 25 [Hokovirus HKV1]